MNSVPQDFPMAFSMAPNSPLVDEVPLVDFADTSELFNFGHNLMPDDSMLNDLTFTFPDVDFDSATYDVANWDLGMNEDIPLDNFDNINPDLLVNDYPHPLTDLQTTSYLYPQNASSKKQRLLPVLISDIQSSPAAKASRPSLPRLVKSRTARSSNKKKPKKPINAPIHIPVPLSQLYPRVPLEDVAAWICRPTEFRQAEWRQRRDYPKMSRPMNAFILYHKAVSERAKRYGNVESHQVISKITGASWQVESDEVKKRFNQLAELEKGHHAAAFPDYKYSPKRSSSAHNPVKSKAKAKVPAKISVKATAEATATVIDSDDSNDDKLFAAPCFSDLRLYQARLESSLKQAREESPLSVSSLSTTKSSFGPRDILFARGAVKSTRSGIESSARQLNQQFSQRLRAKQQQVNYAEDSDSDYENDEPVRATKRHRASLTADAIGVKW